MPRKKKQTAEERKQKVQKYNRKYWIENKEQLRKDNKEYYYEHRDEQLEYHKEWYQEAKNKEEYREQINANTRRWSKTLKGKFKDYKRSAKIRELSFELTFDQFTTFWQKPCMFGCSIETISLDRVDSSKGYTLDNIQVMCAYHNLMKNDFAMNEFIKLCELVVTYSKKSTYNT